MSRSDVLGICRPILEFPTTRHFHSISDQQFNGLRIRDKSPRNSGHLGKEKAVPSIKIALKSCGYEITVLHPLCNWYHTWIEFTYVTFHKERQQMAVKLSSK